MMRKEQDGVYKKSIYELPNELEKSQDIDAIFDRFNIDLAESDSNRNPIIRQDE